METEPLGITYDRMRLARVQARLAGRFGWRRVVEVWAGGAKAKPSLYSIGFALAGLEVDLAGGDPDALDDWRSLGLAGKVRFLDGDPGDLDPGAGRWDLAWNFVTASSGGDLTGRLRTMAGLAPSVMTVHCNGFHYGAGWHRILHAAARVPWTHGRWLDGVPPAIRAEYHRAGLRTIGSGFFDAPGWPDPPGPRDLRLHRIGIGHDSRAAGWEAPIVEMHRARRYPIALRALEAAERIQPWPIRAVLAHLYYHVGSR